MSDAVVLGLPRCNHQYKPSHCALLGSISSEANDVERESPRSRTAVQRQAPLALGGTESKGLVNGNMGSSESDKTSYKHNRH